MSQYGKSGEESMEEILASIRSSVDTQNSGAPAQHALPDGNSNGAARPVAPAPISTARVGSGRLQDALSHMNGAQPVKAPQSVAPAAPSSPTPSTPPVTASTAPSPILSTPASSQSTPKPATSPATGLNDLSDLFADPAPKPKAPESGSETSSSATAFGTVMKDTTRFDTIGTATQPSSVSTTSAPPAPVAASPSSPLSSAEAAALVKPQAKPEASSEPDVIASMASPEPTSPEPPAPEKQTTEPKPKREPSFAALKTLATGKPPEKEPTPDSDAKSSPASSVLLPEMRDLPGTNPVAQMHSMAALAPKSRTGGFIPKTPTAAPETPSVNKTIEEDIGEAPTEIVVQPAAQNTAAAEPDLKADTETTADTDSGAREAVATGSRSLEDIVVELLKPQLANWLEANMPRIVERALRAEQQKTSDK